MALFGPGLLNGDPANSPVWPRTLAPLARLAPDLHEA